MEHEGKLKLKCKRCSDELRLDGVDFHFKGCQDNYYICDNCHIGAVEEIRFGKSYRIIWDCTEP